MEYVWKYIGKRARELSVKPISDEEMELKGFIVKKNTKSYDFFGFNLYLCHVVMNYCLPVIPYTKASRRII